MLLTITPHPDFVLVTTHGPLDGTARASFRQDLHPLVGQPGTRLIIDLKQTPRVDSQGLGNLVGLVADANTNGSRVILCNIQPHLATVLAVTKLERYFEIRTTLVDGMAALNELQPERLA